MGSRRLVVLLGATGQLGVELSSHLSCDEHVTLIPLSHGQFEFRDPTALSRLFESTRPWAVVNCIAYNKVDAAEQERGLALEINAVRVADLASRCREAGSLLYHFSTDYVFPGDSSEPYPETAAARPLNAYGFTKLQGERAVLDGGPGGCVIRTCGVYGRHRSPGGKPNFVDAILAKGRAGERLEVVDDLVCTPTSAADLASAVMSLLREGATGLFHVTNSGECSWHEFASKAVAIAGIGCEVGRVRFAKPASGAERPPYTVLSVKRISSLLGRPMRHWSEALEDYLR